MNHLGHLFLSGEDPQILFGNFITDFLKPVEQRAVSTTLQQGIKLHLFIDRTIDFDPVFKTSIRLIKMRQGRYAPVVADIYYDYLLVHHWQQFSTIDFMVFKAEVYEKLLKGSNNTIPASITERVERMVNHDFLSSYESFNSMNQTFSFLKKRAKFENQFDNAHADFLYLFPELNEQFLNLFPRMIVQVQEFRINLQNSTKS